MKTLLASFAAIFFFAVPLFAGTDPVMDGASHVVNNLHIVTEGQIYRGGHPGDAGIEALANAGVKTIVDLQGGDRNGNAGESAADRLEEQKITEANGMTFFNIPLSSGELDFDDQDKKIEQALDLISDPGNQPVFVHCYHGEDRTGAVVALYRIVFQGCSVEQAHTEMMEDGHDPILFWIDAFLYKDHSDFSPIPGRTSSCPLR